MTDYIPTHIDSYTDDEYLKVNADDYRNENGLWVCGKCHQMKEMISPFNGRKVMCLCGCANDRYEEDLRKEREKQKVMRINDMKRTGFPDGEMSRSTFDKDDMVNEEVSHVARNYAINFAHMKEIHKGIIFYGNVGTGKSFMASCIANYVIDHGYSALCTSFSRIANKLQSNKEDKQAYLDSLNEYDLLVLDDVTAERDSQWMNEIVTSVIDARYRSGLPMIVTTNLTLDQMVHNTDISKNRIYSRLVEMCYSCEVKGIDRRKARLAKDFADMEKILKG